MQKCCRAKTVDTSSWVRQRSIKLNDCSVMQNTRNPISKALKALAWLVENSGPEVGVRELATAMKIAPSSAHRLLMGLAEEGFIRQNADSGRYELGLEFLRLAYLA